MIRIAATVLAVVNLGGVDQALFERTVKHLETQLHTAPVVWEPRETVAGDDLDAEADALGALVTDDVIGVVAVSAFGEGVEFHGKIYPTRKVAFVNVTGLKPDEADPERYGRRVEKEALRSAGLLLGMQPCPMPLCALFPYMDDRGLDYKGRTFCPPCIIKFEKRAKEVGLKPLSARPPDGAE